MAELRPVVATLQPQELETESYAEERVTSTKLTPITTTLTPQSQPEKNVARLTPIRHMLQPVKESSSSSSDFTNNLEDEEIVD
jgi:hypothetical protein